MHKNSGDLTKKKSGQEMMGSSDIMELVENEKAFSEFVDQKFEELDVDRDGKLSVKELQPAVEDIGAALGLPAQGSSPESGRVYTKVLHEFTHDRQEKISKTEFKEVLSDFLLGMASGLKRDSLVILRIDGEDLHEFVESSSFEQEILSVFSEIESSHGSLRECIVKAFERLTVDQGMPPATDPWVMSNILEPALQPLGPTLEQSSISPEIFLAEFRKAADNVAQLLKEQPTIVAHSQNTFDGSDIKRLLSNKFELEKMLDSAVKSVPKDRHGKISKECLRLALDSVASFAGLPPLGAVDQMDRIMNEALKIFDAGYGKMVKEDEFKKLLMEVLRSTMVKLQGKPVLVSMNSVVHEPLASSSTLVHPSSP